METPSQSFIWKVFVVLLQQMINKHALDTYALGTLACNLLDVHCILYRNSNNVLCIYFHQLKVLRKHILLTLLNNVTIQVFSFQTVIHFLQNQFYYEKEC